MIKRWFVYWNPIAYQFETELINKKQFNHKANKNIKKSINFLINR